MEWLIRYSTSISRWSLRFIYDECKRRRYMLSFSPLIFINNHKLNSISLNQYDWEKNENNEQNYDRNKYRKQSTSFMSSIINALISAAVIFSWQNNGISDEEL